MIVFSKKLFSFLPVFVENEYYRCYNIHDQMMVKAISLKCSHSEQKGGYNELF